MDLIWSGVKINSVPRGSKSTTLLENGELQREKNYTEVHFNCVFSLYLYMSNQIIRHQNLKSFILQLYKFYMKNMIVIWI